MKNKIIRKFGELKPIKRLRVAFTAYIRHIKGEPNFVFPFQPNLWHVPYILRACEKFPLQR